MKKFISVLLAIVCLLSVMPAVSGETNAVTDFTVDEAHKSTTAVSGDAESGYTFTLSGSGTTHIMTAQSYPLATLSFDFGYKYSGNQFGVFGVSLTGDVNAIENVSNENTLVFFYRVSGAQCHIYLRHSDGEKEIAVFTEADRPGDGYWSPNVSNFSFVRDGEHWFLALDGHLCNNVEENTEYSYLESVLGNSIFDNNDSVYLHVGGYNSGTVYFKQLSVTSEDGAWETRAVDSFQYSYGGAVREYRGQGYTAGTLHSAVPTAAVGSKTDGHVIDFSDTDGYAQSTEGFDLKNTAFQIAPITYDGNTANLWYYLGFTANPSVIQYHSSKPSDTIEFRAASVYGNNYTGGWIVTNSSGCLATPTNISLGKLFSWKTHRYEDTYSNAYMTVSFVQEKGADGALHWYMKTVCSGDTIIVKSTDTETDKYLQFDSIIDKPVYFRIGTDGKNTDSSFKMYCKAVDTSEDGSGGWAAESQALPTVSAAQEAYVKIVKNCAAIIGSDANEDITAHSDEAKQLYESYRNLSADAKQWLTAMETAIAEKVANLITDLDTDVNADLTVDRKDIAVIKQSWLAGEYKKEYDFNAGGTVDIEDAVFILFDILNAEAVENVETVLNVKDFGAVGDGITNDGEAIFYAIMALNSAGENAKLVFESNKTYYYNDDGIGGDIVFSLKNLENVHIVGDNTTIVTEAPYRMIRTYNTKDCSISGFNFDYGKRPYFMAASATEIDTDAGTCVMEIGEGMAESYLGLTEIGQTVSLKTNGNSGTPFGVIESETGRYHMFINKYELVGKDKIKIYFVKSASPYTAAWMPKLANQRLICPTPGVGHMVEHAFHFDGDTDLTLKNVKLYSSCRFAIALSNSEGRIMFDNVDIVPNPALKGTFEETDFTSWRDGWHLKENRSKVVWKNCEATGLQDDIFNVSSSVMWVKEVLASDCINMYWPETGGVFRAALRQGDPLTVINTDTGEIIARTEVKSVVTQSGSDNIVTLAEPIENLPSGENIKVLFEGLVAPGSLIRNCDFDGTFRFRGPITITDTTFICKRMWLDVLNESWLEGPIPRDILFKNCTIFFESSGTYVHASAYNSNTAENAYHIKNIVFENCVVDQECFEIGTGDEVIFRNCVNQ